MLEYQKCSTQIQVLITFTRTAQIITCITIHDLTRAREPLPQSKARNVRPVYQNAHN